ncbi:MAG: NADH-quinone oxidoreductase subunit C [Candidatus Delongbacteria bacterium]|nr:NADH-quinone oxidoreductase subunit C [Candidatus Cloacimonadota bacterium]MCA9786430.1 NADH-quinone oxidoreductase subunit C [Candidatus Cloacimonadota bacterium]MCB9473956.1 NADH-quinone oxidoreductase subunit C [Candidatus Delongbacteria bacterium]
MSPADLRSRLEALLPGLEFLEASDRLCLTLPAERLLDVAALLRRTPELAFDLLSDHCAVDRPAEQQIELLWQLDSTSHNHCLALSVTLPRENPVSPSLHTIWTNALWQEREVYDLFGVLYDNHPDLRRLFLEDDWKGWPLRKDYEDDFMITEPGGGRR